MNCTDCGNEAEEIGGIVTFGMNGEVYCESCSLKRGLVSDKMIRGKILLHKKRWGPLHYVI